MKYYKLLDTVDLRSEEPGSFVYLSWKDIFNFCVEKEVEEELDFLHYLLVNVPVLNNDGELEEKTVLLAKLVDEKEFKNNTIQLPILDDLSICYSV